MEFLLLGVWHTGIWRVFRAYSDWTRKAVGLDWEFTGVRDPGYCRAGVRLVGRLRTSRADPPDNKSKLDCKVILIFGSRPCVSTGPRVLVAVFCCAALDGTRASSQSL